MRLVHALIAKSIAETILVAALAVGFYLIVFPASFHGWGEAKSRVLAGWVVDHSAPAERITVQLFIDDKFVASGTANLSRRDVVAAGWSQDEWHGYEFSAPQLLIGEHKAEVYAVHASGGGVRQTLQLVGDPILFTVNGTGELTDLKAREERK